MSEKVARELAPREQQIMAVVCRLKNASVAQVRDAMKDPPSYSAVRTMLGQLEKKGLLKRDRSDVTHIYSPTGPYGSMKRSAVRRLLDVFFPNQPALAIAALIDESAKDLTASELEELRRAIDRAKAKGKS
ncbi:MAG: BlaI/MecI/CopY family transcriptional regulator [Planctomycetales bacterium]|nr:BlaI/MecI/CopY family transcriptional regulator [Planctomycetales bacterium]